MERLYKYDKSASVVVVTIGRFNSISATYRSLILTKTDTSIILGGENPFSCVHALKTVEVELFLSKNTTLEIDKVFKLFS